MSSAKNARKAAANKARRNENREADAKRKRLSPQEQIAKLDSRLGRGVGAERERAKLAVKMAQPAAKTQKKNAA